MDDLIDKAWSCFQRIIIDKNTSDCQSISKTKFTDQNFYKSK